MKLCNCGCGKPTRIAKRTNKRYGHVKGQPVWFIRGHYLRGKRVGNFIHGAAGTPEYGAYKNAKSRCTNPRFTNWQHYGGRGIRFLFARFEDFIACLGPRPAGMTLDRINNDSHYMPGNVRWATWSEQGRNKRPPRKRSLLPT